MSVQKPAFNRRIHKEFTRTTEGIGEYQPDANTMALYHFNEGGTLVDSSGNGNDIKVGNHIRIVPGLYGNAAQFRGLPVLIRCSNSLNNFTDKITLEASLYLEGKGPRGINGAIISRLGSYRLQIEGRQHRLQFTLWTKRRPITIRSDTGLPLKQWVHVAAVYNGNEVAIYINGVKQSQTRTISGNIRIPRISPTMLGSSSDYPGGVRSDRIHAVPAPWVGTAR